MKQLLYHIHTIGIFAYTNDTKEDAVWLCRVKRALALAFDNTHTSNQPLRYTVLLHNAAQLPSYTHEATIPGYANYGPKHVHFQRTQLVWHETSATQIDIWTTGEHLIGAHIIQRLLTRQHASFVHAAGFSIHGQGVLLPSFSGAGKTTLMATMARMKEVEVLGDDLVIVQSNGTLSAYPRPLCLYPYHKALFPDYFAKHRWPLIPTWGITHKIARRLAIMAGLDATLDQYVSPLPYLPTPLTTVIPEARIAEQHVPLQHVIVLAREKGINDAKLVPITSAHASSFMLNTLLHETQGMQPHSLLTQTGKQKSIKTEIALLETIISQAIGTHRAQTHLLSIPDSWNPDQIAHTLPSMISEQVSSFAEQDHDNNQQALANPPEVTP